MKNMFLLLLLFGYSVSPAIAETTVFTYDALDRIATAEYKAINPLDSISYTYDTAGNILTFAAQHHHVMPGDINHDGLINLRDAILGVQVMAGLKPTDSVVLRSDVNGDGKLGMAEVINSFNHLSEL